jgi:hypothetical protein
MFRTAIAPVSNIGAASTPGVIRALKYSGHLGLT